MKIKEFKEKQGLSYADLANFLGTSKTRAYNICTKESSELKLCEINAILKNANGLITPVDIGLEVR